MSTTRSPRILISDELDPAALEVFRRSGFEPELRTNLAEVELCEVIRGVDALVVRSATKVTRRVVEAADALRVIGRAGIGVDNVDLEAATERGIVVMNTPRGNATTTAEQILLDLREKAPRMLAESARDTLVPRAPAARRSLEDAVRALVSIGYSDKEARKSVERAATEVQGDDLELLVRTALQR